MTLSLLQSLMNCEGRRYKILNPSFESGTQRVNGRADDALFNAAMTEAFNRRCR